MGSLKEFAMAVCSMKSVNLKNDTTKTLGTHFSNKKFTKKGNKCFQSYIEDSKHFNIMKNEKSRT